MPSCQAKARAADMEFTEYLRPRHRCPQQLETQYRWSQRGYIARAHKQHTLNIDLARHRDDLLFNISDTVIHHQRGRVVYGKSRHVAGRKWGWRQDEAASTSLRHLILKYAPTWPIPYQVVCCSQLRDEFENPPQDSRLDSSLESLITDS